MERRWSSYGHSTVVGCDVVTERGVYVGRVRDFEFDPEDGLVQRLIVDALGLPAVPEGVVSAYAVDVGEILSAGADRIVVRDGAEARVEQLSQSLLQRLELTAPPWEEDLATYADYYAQDAYEEQARADAEYYAHQTARLERERMRTRDAPAGSAANETRGDPARARVAAVRATRCGRGHGEPPPRAQAYEDEREAYRRRPQFDEWVEPEERVPECEYEYEVEARGETAAAATGGAAMGGAFTRRGGVRVAAAAAAGGVGPGRPADGRAPRAARGRRRGAGEEAAEAARGRRGEGRVRRERRFALTTRLGRTREKNVTREKNEERSSVLRDASTHFLSETTALCGTSRGPSSRIRSLASLGLTYASGARGAGTRPAAATRRLYSLGSNDALAGRRFRRRRLPLRDVRVRPGTFGLVLGRACVRLPRLPRPQPSRAAG